jgi:cell wall assembly regulator SMI1
MAKSTRKNTDAVRSSIQSGRDRPQVREADDSTEMRKLVALARRAPGPPGEELPVGLTSAQLRKAEERLGQPLPEVFRDWLRTMNGACFGPGGFLGIATKRKGLDLERVLAPHPAWRANGWFPFAGDGTGNHFVTLELGKNPPVGFVEASDDNIVAYVVASSLTLFIRLLLEKELGQHKGWPFNESLTSRLLSLSAWTIDSASAV